MGSFHSVITQSLEAPSLVGLDFTAVLQPSAADTAKNFPFILRAAQPDRCMPSFETLYSINGFVTKGYRMPFFMISQTSKPRQITIETSCGNVCLRPQSEETPSPVRFATAKDDSVGIFYEWGQGIDGSTGSAMGFEGYAQQENESLPPPTTETNPKSPPPTTASPTSPQPPQLTAASARGTVIIGNQNIVNITCHTVDHD